MSDLSLYEFGDIVWDDFCQSEDHIVPHHIGEEASEKAFVSDSCKKPRHELTGVLGKSRVRSENNNICQEKDQGIISVLNDRRKIMLEKHSQSHSPDDIFPSSCDNNTVQVVSSLPSDGTRMSSHCFKSNNNTDFLGDGLCTTDSILIDKSTAVDSNTYDFALCPVPQTDNDLSFFDSDHPDSDSSDFLYYGWPDIGNFEDVDRMFRSCDSTFGLGADNEDELEWFSSSDAVERAGNMLKSEFKVSYPASGTMAKESEKHEPTTTNETCSSLGDAGFKSASVSCKSNSWQSDKDKSNTLGDLSVVNQTSSSDSKDYYRPRKQAVKLNSEGQQKISATHHSTTGSSAMTNVQQKNQGRCEAKRKEPYGSAFYYNGSLPTEDIELATEATYHQTLSSGGIHQQKQALGSESVGYLQNNIPYMQSDYSHPSDHTTMFPTHTAVKSDTSGFTNISPKESYSSNQVLSAESFRGPALRVDTDVPSEKWEKLHHQQSFQSTFSSKAKDMEMGFQVPLCDAGSTEEKVKHSGKNFENHIDDGVPGEFGSSTMQESTPGDSGLDESSLETASFHQLQLVMEQLDAKTKQCIRDSLYRLARSAERRHNYANLNGSRCGDDRDAIGVSMGDDTTKCTALMDMETGTNPIDRSIAHLLFYRPSDSSAIAAQDSLSFKSPALINGSVCSPPVMPDKLVNDEAMAAEMEINAADG